MEQIDFDAAFQALTGNSPFPWQQALYRDWLALGKFPQSCNLPTGLGKTSVIAVWLIALANHPDRMPRRLVYVVNRRTVVDQTTNEVENYKNRLPNLPEMFERLCMMCATVPVIPLLPEPLALSTLRGQFADNREWSADPSRAAVICGTVDMVGSRLLFSGYGIGFKSRPLHAGFLGQDVLLIHDEAHLEPAFQKLIEAIRDEQHIKERTGELPWPKLRVMALTATSRGNEQAFELTDEEKGIPNELPAEPNQPIHFVWQRMKSKKALKFHSAKRDAVAKKIGEIARQRWMRSEKAILIFVRTIDDVKTVQDELTKKLKDGTEELRSGAPATSVQLLTGTIRGLERDELATRDPVFARFMPKPKVTPMEGTVYLICTSAGEVGVDISADHMVCDLTTLDSLAQRFGRVNRRGEGQADIDLVYETDPNPKPPSPDFETARWLTKTALERLTKCDWIENRLDASPEGLGVLMRQLSEDERKAAFAPSPIILPTSDILFDAWALTTIRGKLPGRTIVEPYLHGISGWEPPETHVAWREEVEITKEELLDLHRPADLLEDYPLKPHELLRDNSSRVFDRLKKLKADEKTPVWIVSDDDSVDVTTLGDLIAAGKEGIEHKIVLLPPTAGGLENGMLTSDSKNANDVADDWFEDAERKIPRRIRAWSNEDFQKKTEDMRLVRRIDMPSDDDDAETRSWLWFELVKDGDSDGSKSNKKPVLWEVHVGDVVKNATEIVNRLPLSEDIQNAIILAARFHDHGKWRKKFQTVLGNFQYPELILAKSGKKGGRMDEPYRHEFGSLLNVQLEDEFKNLNPEQQEIVLHLIAVHHGYGRPHFPAELAFDPEPPVGSDSAAVAVAVPQRFARLQRKYGRWGLAYLESLLRAADYAASAKPSKFVEDEK